MTLNKMIIYSAILSSIIQGCQPDEEIRMLCGSNHHGTPDLPGWNQRELSFEPIVNLEGIYFLDANTGLVFGGYKIWRTEDQGLHWNEVFDGPRYTRFQDISFIDSLYGYISFKDLKKGYLIFTNDGGMHWSQINLPAYQNLTHISFKDPLNGIGSIYDSHTSLQKSYFNVKTSNGGMTWEKLDSLSAPSYPIPQLKLFTDGFGYMPGDSGEIHITIDAGKTWSTIHSSVNTIYRLQFIDQDTGFVSDDNSLFKTVDGGQTWQPISNHYCSMIHFFSGNEGITVQQLSSDWDYDVGVNCNSFLTTYDGGASWNQSTHLSTFDVRGFHFLNPSLGFIIPSTPPFSLIVSR